jgi:Lon protease-like protein
VTIEVPLFPLNTVLYPGGYLPLRIFEQRYLDMCAERMRSSQPFGVCLIRSGAEVGEAAEPEAVGCLAQIEKWDMHQLGILELVVLGTQRFEVRSRRVTAQKLVIGEIEVLEAEAPQILPDEHAVCAEILRALLEELREAPVRKPHRFDDANWVGYRLAELVPAPLEFKQTLLACEALERLERMHAYLREKSAAARNESETKS